MCIIASFKSIVAAVDALLTGGRGIRCSGGAADRADLSSPASVFRVRVSNQGLELWYGIHYNMRTHTKLVE